MAGNSSASQKHGKHDENNVEYRGNTTRKGSEKPDYPLASTEKRARHIRALLFCD